MGTSLAMNVLFVDDDVDMCELAQAALSRFGVDVEWCTGSHAAIKRLRQRHFDAVITDLGLERGDGIALCEQLRRERSDMPVFVVTGDAAAEAAAQRVGARGFFVKPVSMETLADALRQALVPRA